MGMQDRDGTGASLQLAVVLGEGFNGLPAAAGDQRIEYTLMPPCQRPQLLGQGESQQEILGGHLFIQLALQPLLTLVVLAVGTVAVTAGVGYEDVVVALAALCLHQGTERSTAGLHGGQRPAMARQDRPLILRQKVGLERLDDR